MRVSARIATACDELRMERKRDYEWREDPEFCKRMADADEACTDYLIANAIKQANKKSDLLVWNLFKKRRPAVYGILRVIARQDNPCWPRLSYCFDRSGCSVVDTEP
jgi:hypothetical protein